MFTRTSTHHVMYFAAEVSTTSVFTATRQVLRSEMAKNGHIRVRNWRKSVFLPPPMIIKDVIRLRSFAEVAEVHGLFLSFWACF